VGIVGSDALNNFVGVYGSLMPAVSPLVRIDYKHPNYATGNFFRELQVETLVVNRNPFIESYYDTILDVSPWFAMTLNEGIGKPVGIIVKTESDPSDFYT